MYRVPTAGLLLRLIGEVVGVAEVGLIEGGFYGVGVYGGRVGELVGVRAGGGDGREPWMSPTGWTFPREFPTHYLLGSSGPGVFAS